ncbi:hypothetical protein ILYODFUR_025240 [Ilyodon furcidens]|uniref:Uncharacterized protein n=1 Tax=Ilyodon furcidens TaxID=33524 RepID=A0ABV0TDX7_9TELE
MEKSWNLPSSLCRRSPGRLQHPTPQPDLRMAVELGEEKPYGVQALTGRRANNTEAPGLCPRNSKKRRQSRATALRCVTETAGELFDSSSSSPPLPSAALHFSLFPHFQQIRIKILSQNMAAASASCYREMKKLFSFFPLVSKVVLLKEDTVHGR